MEEEEGRRIPLAIVDEHGDVMTAVSAMCREAGGGCCMVHFDSHPDMDAPVLPRALLRKIGEPGWAEAAQPHVDVATWILPLVLAGEVGSVVWVKPPWSEQIDLGSYSLTVFSSPTTGIGVTGPSRVPYWAVSEVWADDVPPDALTKKPFHLTVVGELTADVVPCDRPWLLDVDEDYFSCANPVRETLDAFSPGSLAHLRQAFPTHATDSAEFMGAVAKMVHTELFRLNPTARRRLPAVKTMLRFITPCAEQALCDWCAENWAAERALGCELYPPSEAVRVGDLHELPHHITPAAELRPMLTAVFGGALRNLPRPVGVSVAQSITDGYVPAPQAPFLHRACLALLTESFPMLGQPAFPASPLKTTMQAVWRPGMHILAEVHGEEVTFNAGRVVGVTPLGLRVRWIDEEGNEDSDEDDGDDRVPWDAVKATGERAQDVLPLADLKGWRITRRWL